MKILRVGQRLHQDSKDCACGPKPCHRCGGRAHASSVDSYGARGVDGCEVCDAARWSEAPAEPPAAPPRQPTREWQRLVYPVSGGQLRLLVVPVGSPNEPRELGAMLASGATPIEIANRLRALADELEKLENDYTGKVDEALNTRI